MKNLKETVSRILEIQAILEANKPLYDELDDLVLELVEEKITDIPLGAAAPGKTLRIVDNFAEKNTAFRVAAIRRFEAKVEEEGKRTKKVDSK